MAKASGIDMPPRSSTRPRRKRSSAGDTISVKQKMSAITISDSSDPIVPTALDQRDGGAPNRPWGRKGKAPLLESNHPMAPVQDPDDEDQDEVEEYEFTEEDYDLGTDEEDFDDNQSVISVASSDSDDSEFALSDRPWAKFSPAARMEWEAMYAMVSIRAVASSWEATELYQAQKDKEMLRYIDDFPIPQWLITQEEAQRAFARLLERTRWRQLGQPIYGRHDAFGNTETGNRPSHNAGMSTSQPNGLPPAQLPREPIRSSSQPQERPKSLDRPGPLGPQKSPQIQNVPRSSAPPQSSPHTAMPPHQGPPQQGLPQQTTPQQTLPAQTPPQPNAQPQMTPLQGLPPQSLPAQAVPSPNGMAPPGMANAGIPSDGVPAQNMQNGQTMQNMHPPGMLPQAMYPPGMHPPGMHPQGMMQPQFYYPQPHPHMQQMGPAVPQHPGYYQHPGLYGHPGMGQAVAPMPGMPYGMGYGGYPQPLMPTYRAVEPVKRRPKKETPPPASPPPPPQTPPYEARKRPVEKKTANKPGRKPHRKHAEAEEFPWTRKLDFNAEKAKATWDISVYDKKTLDDMAATRARNVAVIDDIDQKIQEQQRKRALEKKRDEAMAAKLIESTGLARAAKKLKDKQGQPSEVDGKKVRQKREGRPKGDVSGDPYHSGVFAFDTQGDEERAISLGYLTPDEVIDAAELGKVDLDTQTSIRIYWNPGKKGMTENLEQGKFSVRDTVATRKQLEKTPILTRRAAECVVDFCPDMLWRSMLLRITSEAGCGNKDVRDRFCYNGCYCDKATITKRISAALGQKQTQPKSKGYQPGEWEWYDENVKDFSKYIDYFGMRTSHRNMLKIQMAGDKRKREKEEPQKDGDNPADEDLSKRQKPEDTGGVPREKEGDGNEDAGNESAEDSDDSNAVSLQDSDVLDKMDE